MKQVSPKQDIEISSLVSQRATAAPPSVMIIIMITSLKLAICCQSHLPRNKVILVHFLTYLPNIYPGFQIRKPFAKIVSLQQLPIRRTYQTVPHVIPGRKTKSRQNYLQKALRGLF